MNNISLEEEFREWNLKTPTKQGSTIPKERNSTMIERLKETIPKLINQETINLLTIQNIEYLKEIKKRFSSNGDLYSSLQGNNNANCSSSLHRYIKFLEEKVKIREKKFQEWLKTKVESSTPLNTYPKALREKIPNKLKEIGENDYSNIFQCLQLKYLMKLSNRLSKKGDLYDKKDGGISSSSISKYIEFLIEYELYNITENYGKNFLSYPNPSKSSNFTPFIIRNSLIFLKTKHTFSN